MKCVSKTDTEHLVRPSLSRSSELAL
jgi:hypothetical protein